MQLRQLEGDDGQSDCADGNWCRRQTGQPIDGVRVWAGPAVDLSSLDRLHLSFIKGLQTTVGT